MGSVKDLTVLKKPTEEKSGIGHFQFSDRYSVFDWGGMPDEIPNKGASLAIMTTHFFELLGKIGIHTHYREIVKDGNVFSFDEIKEPFDTIEVELLRVLKPEIREGEYDYSIYKGVDKNFLIPMEFIYRNSIPKESSFWKRYDKGEIKIEIPDDIKPDIPLKEPILDVSTKLEESDRYLSWDEVKELAHLSEERLMEIKEILLKVSKLIREETDKVGLVNQDGKFEFGINPDGNIIVVDALGTLDECRFEYEGISLSKEILRKYYRKTEWYKGVVKAKEKDIKDWKPLVGIKPPHIPKELLDVVSRMYQSVANLISGRKFFNVPHLKELIKDLSREY
ncbi:phosphoribosylaminoimidazolesuccinocarboxamide synthase [candidate division WOR-3 bacterium]|nr:phosphoribosylaminoimidazolesuccinocarboxamide synthase [candidate division WOR-3 bacterium]